MIHHISILPYGRMAGASICAIASEIPALISLVNVALKIKEKYFPGAKGSPATVCPVEVTRCN